MLSGQECQVAIFTLLLCNFLMRQYHTQEQLKNSTLIGLIVRSYKCPAWYIIAMSQYIYMPIPMKLGGIIDRVKGFICSNHGNVMPPVSAYTLILSMQADNVFSKQNSIYLGWADDTCTYTYTCISSQ